MIHDEHSKGKNVALAEEGITSLGGGERPLLQAYKHLTREGRDGIVEGVA